MNLPELTLFSVGLAALPIAVVLFAMIGRGWSGSQAGLLGWATAVFISLLFFGANLPLLLVALGRALLLSLFVLYIIWMALLLYHTVNDAGAIAVIGQEMPRLAQDRPGQALLLAWIFGSFLQGATGFGVPAAVIAPLLVGLGFTADVAVTMALLGHGWAVTFGSLGSSYLSLIAVTGVSGDVLAGPVTGLLALCCLGCGLSVLWLAGGPTAVRRRGLFLLALTIVMAATQWLVAGAGLWPLASFSAGLAGLVVAIIYFMRRARRVESAAPQFNVKRFLTAFAPYAILIAVVVVGEMVLPDLLDVVEINRRFPQVATSFGWTTPAGPGQGINLFGHGGALLLYATLLAFGWFRWRGVLTSESGSYSGRAILQKTGRGIVKPTIAIIALVTMATTMQHAGMTQLLAVALGNVAGPIYPLVSAFIGALGAFMTGSNTNSNVVFGELQRQTAVTLNLSVPLILAAQTAGGAIGSVFAPAKVVVGCSTIPGAADGRVLRLTAVYSLGIILAVALLTWLLA